MEEDPLIGHHVHGVRLLERLGHGTMATVYRGSSRLLGHEVAVKIIRDDHTLEERERFLREGLAAASIHSPHVVRVFASGEADGNLFLVLELIDGVSLGQRIRVHGRVPPGLAAQIGADVAIGLGALHAASIMHRDIKPDNIMLSTQGRAKITDLGLAKMPSDSQLTSTDALVGTPLYLAPEAITHPALIGPPADIYSLGATMYHALCGRAPFTGSDPLAVIQAKIEHSAPPLPLQSVLPSGLQGLLARCLERDPRLRPTAAVVACELTALARRSRPQP
jgi:serine/threonine protein kinase